MNQVVYNERLLDFLLYSYFGCGSNELAQEGLRQCAYRAYLDLSRKVGFYYSTSELNTMRNKKSSEEDKAIAEEYKKAKVKLIEDICSRILKPTEDKDAAKVYNCTDETFDLWHKAKCKEIKDTMNGRKWKDSRSILKESDSFTYGLAQKWVNMTLKYLGLLGMLPEGLTPKSLHVPIDSFILEELKEESKIDGIEKDGDTYKYKTKPWSQLKKYDDYMEIQNAIRQIAGNTEPIEWESSAWIEIAKTRRDKKTEERSGNIR